MFDFLRRWKLGSASQWWWVQSSVASHKWKCSRWQYIGPADSQGRVNIYVSVRRKDGSPASGVKVWLDTGVPEDRSFQITDGAGACNFEQTGDSNFDPNRGESGPYSVFVDGLPSDWARGAGLPLKQHVTYYADFVEVDGEPPPPSGDFVTAEQVREIVKQENLKRWQ